VFVAWHDAHSHPYPDSYPDSYPDADSYFHSWWGVCGFVDGDELMAG